MKNKWEKFESKKRKKKRKPQDVSDRKEWCEKQRKFIKERLKNNES